MMLDWYTASFDSPSRYVFLKRHGEEEYDLFFGPSMFPAKAQKGIMMKDLGILEKHRLHLLGQQEGLTIADFVYLSSFLSLGAVGLDLASLGMNQIVSYIKG